MTTGLFSELTVGWESLTLPRGPCGVLSVTSPFLCFPVPTPLNTPPDPLKCCPLGCEELPGLFLAPRLGCIWFSSITHDPSLPPLPAGLGELSGVPTFLFSLHLKAAHFHSPWVLFVLSCPFVGTGHTGHFTVYFAEREAELSRSSIVFWPPSTSLGGMGCGGVSEP